MNQSTQEQTPSLPLVSEADETAYALWLFGDDELTDAQHQAFETRYQNDAAFRKETDELRATANFVSQNVEPLLALMEPPRPAHEREEVWQEFQKRRAQKRAAR